MSVIGKIFGFAKLFLDKILCLKSVGMALVWYVNCVVWLLLSHRMKKERSTTYGSTVRHRYSK
jgi:hypothetical protein